MTQPTIERIPAEVDPKAFMPLHIEHGLLVDLTDDEFPTVVFGFDGDDLTLSSSDTHYGMVTEGEIMLSFNKHSYIVTAGMFFVAPGLTHILGGAGRGLVISRVGYHALFQLGGPIEERGRLRYIDGCSDTLLVGPPVVGEPCLNHLHMPVGTKQTQHTHPASRIGVIMAGRGECRTPNATVPLEPGMGWYIPTGCEHSFFTFDEVLDVVAWHPETDTGPSHQNHPMVNRTYVDSGESARDVESIQTKEITG